jgi:hypothetical protein
VQISVYVGVIRFLTKRTVYILLFFYPKVPQMYVLVLRVSVAPRARQAQNFKIQKKVEVLRVSVAPKNRGEVILITYTPQ